MKELIADIGMHALLTPSPPDALPAHGLLHVSILLVAVDVDLFSILAYNKNEKLYDLLRKGVVVMRSALDLAKYIVSKCTADGHPVSNLQLQKILYFIQKHFLLNDCLAFDDDIEAWQFGPVVPNVYYDFCGFGAMPITTTYEDLPQLFMDSRERRIVDEILLEKRTANPWALVESTHKKDGAWDRIYRDGLGNHAEIPRSYIKKYG